MIDRIRITIEPFVFSEDSPLSDIRIRTSVEQSGKDKVTHETVRPRNALLCDYDIIMSCAVANLKRMLLKQESEDDKCGN